jgi:geranylgeranyl pyrophosphate synthase/predicted secreted hydrolase
LVDRRAPEIGLERLDSGRGPRDPHLSRAIREILERGQVPLPDRVFSGEVFVDPHRLDLDFDGNRFFRTEGGSYVLRLRDDATHIGCDLVLSPLKPAIRHGDDGVVHGSGGEDMFYYFIPRCDVTGSVVVRGVRQHVATGSAWYDHEFGRTPPGVENRSGATDTLSAQHILLRTPGGKNDIAWNWASVQLADGSDISVYTLVRVSDEADMGRWAIVVGPDGKRTSYSDLDLHGEGEWRSLRTFCHYPRRWKLRLPQAGIELQLDALIPDQEFITVISQPAFWEGRVEVSGIREGQPVKGLGFVERSGFEQIETLDQFFAAVGHEVRRSVETVLPREPSYTAARALIASEQRDHYMNGVDLPQLGRSLFAPIRDITDRGGKSWRSYAALACCDVVGGDSRKFARWLAMPELMHVGSLIVDDVQDHSTVRRGGPAAHLVHGEALAINAGTAAYFITQHLLQTDQVSPAARLQLYDLYFEAMRAGHAGQALDLSGFVDTLETVVASGDTAMLERSILACHRLKTAAPAGALARMGAVAGGGTAAQVQAVGSFFEAVGLAFQIVDDVLNLRGFKSDLKQRGEDLRNGVVTYPVAKALARLTPGERAQLHRQVQSKPADPATIESMIAQIEGCGALACCLDEASELVESAWKIADPLLPDSTAKVMLRAFGWYVLERHY